MARAKIAMNFWASISMDYVIGFRRIVAVEAVMEVMCTG